jgi:DNA helicase HerA-like ATPase
MNEDRWFVKDNKGKERTGVLMKLEESEHSRYEFEVWFEYTRRAMNDIREGTMLAVPNYATTRDETHYSILEVTSLRPIHYAIGENPTGFPGFVMEAAKNAAQDWTGQDDEPTEDTTTIQCTAIPTNLELVERKDGTPNFETEENIPMVGAVVRILDTEPTRQVVNRELLRVPPEEMFVGGTLILDERIPAYVRIEDFVRVHFGIFGFTGAGKSNLLSTYITKLLDSPQVVKVVLFDLMGEYTALVIDLLNTMDGAYVVCIGERTLPEPVFKYINAQDKARRNSRAPAEAFSRFTLLPKALKPYQAQMTGALQWLIESDKVRVYQAERSMTVYDIFYASEKSLMNYGSRLGQAKKDRLKALIKRLNPTTGYPSKVSATRQVITEILQRIQKEREKETRDYKDFGQYLEPFEEWLRSVEEQLGQELNCGIDMNQLIQELERADHSSLLVVTSHDPNQLRIFAKELGETAFETRRRSGNITPLVSFIFDEADEFIPQKDVGTYKDSREIVEELARRGRKFGLGVGIATQRARYLDTSIMAQPHTYLVSKLPRKSDRDAVAEAFGISEDMFRQTFKFKPGNWLLMSHDATGLKAVPVPIQAEDANERIRRYLEGLKVENPKVETSRLF